MTDERLDEIEKAAWAASPGPWESDGKIIPWQCGEQPAIRVCCDTGDGHAPVCMVQPDDWENRFGHSGGGSRNPIADAHHIATADPPTVLALVAEVRRLREAYELAQRAAFELYRIKLPLLDQPPITEETAAWMASCAEASDDEGSP